MSNILIASFYKSGSNHIADSLASLLGSRRTFLHKSGEGYAQDTQRLDPHVADIMFNRLDGMIYLGHVMGTRHNLGIINVFKPSTIVTMRKLFPCLHSLRKYDDRLVREDKKGNAYSNDDWPCLTNEQKWLWVAYNAIPWYYQYYVSWMKADLDYLPVWYEDHFSDQIASAKRILKFLNVCGLSDEQISKSFLHFNSGYTQDRSVIEMPVFVREIAYNQARAWGPWEKRIVEELLD